MKRTLMTALQNGKEDPIYNGLIQTARCQRVQDFHEKMPAHPSLHLKGKRSQNREYRYQCFALKLAKTFNIFTRSTGVIWKLISSLLFHVTKDIWWRDWLKVPGVWFPAKLLCLNKIFPVTAQLHHCLNFYQVKALRQLAHFLCLPLPLRQAGQIFYCHQVNQRVFHHTKKVHHTNWSVHLNISLNIMMIWKYHL